jgi:hypothetical protein
MASIEQPAPARSGPTRSARLGSRVLCAAILASLTASAAAAESRPDRQGVELLIANLTGDESSEVRAIAAEELGRGGDMRAVAPLLLAVAEKDSVIRLAAVDALARFGERAGSDGDLPLRRMVDRRPPRPFNAQGLLKQIATIDAVVDALGQVVITPGKGDGADWSRGDAAWALGRMGNGRATYYLSRGMSDADNLVRTESARALIRLGDPRGLPVLSQHLVDWFYGPRIALVLRQAHWSPKSDAERTHWWIARRDRADLVRNWETTKAVLVADLKSRFTLDALYAAIAIGQADFIPDATAVLVTGGNQAMAEAFLNCGQPDLRQAGEAWAKARGYTILAGLDDPPVSWGEM